MEAPPACGYLKLRHRHEFHVKVTLEVAAANRDVEFIMFKGVARGLFEELGEPGAYGGANGAGIDFGSRSCEQLAIDFGNKLASMKYRVTEIDISEDGENGATVNF